MFKTAIGRSGLLMLTLATLAAPSQAAPVIDYAALFDSASPSVVVIYARSAQGTARGTGSIITADGLVVTNAHVILDDETPADKVTVYTRPVEMTGDRNKALSLPHTATILAYDAALDLALLQITKRDDNERLRPLPVADSERVRIGEPTAAIGHPSHGALWTLTTGRIGARINDFASVKGKDVFQMETDVNRGNSGGPLLDGNGAMVGINTMIARRDDDGLAITGVNFALRSSVMTTWLDSIGKNVPSAPPAAKPTRPPDERVVERTSPPEPPPARPEKPTVRKPTAPEPKRTRREPLVLTPPTRQESGFRSRERPGTRLRPRDLLRKRADDAFAELDAMTNESATSELFRFISEDEASKRPAPQSRTTRIADRSTGPFIRFDTPTDSGSYPAPMPIKISFKPRDKVPVDVKSLRVFYVKFIDIDLTDRVRPYVKASGINVSEADLPKGRHTLRFELSDRKGRTTRRVVTVTVR